MTISDGEAARRRHVLCDPSGRTDMLWTLKQIARKVPGTCAAHIEKRLEFALARFGGRIQRIQVALEDQNGPRGGLDKNCRIVVRLKEGGDVVAEVADVNWEIAVDRATTRVGHTVARRIARRRTGRRIVQPFAAKSPGATSW
jgi:putative sigma-54 modulation protein